MTKTISNNHPTRQLRLTQILWFLGIFVYLGSYIFIWAKHGSYLFTQSFDWEPSFAQFGISSTTYAMYGWGWEIVTAIVFTVIGVILVWRRPNDPLILIFSLMLIAFGVAFSMWRTLRTIEGIDPFVFWLIYSNIATGHILVLLTLYLFPDGRFVPRWSLWVQIIWSAWMLIGIVFPQVGYFAKGIDYLYIQIAVYGSGVIAQIYRYRKVSTQRQRQQTKWVLFGIALVFLGFMVAFLSPAFLPMQQVEVSFIFHMLLLYPGFYLPRILLPILIGIAILRHHLFDIDTLINRSLVYGTLTFAVGAIYLTSVSLLQMAFRTGTGQVSDPAIVLSTALIAIIFQPLRRHLQSVVDRRFYREKINFRQAFQVFTREVRHYTDLSELLRVIVHRITELFHSSYGALYLQQLGQFQLAESLYLPESVRGLHPNASQLEKLHKGEIIVYKSESFSILVPLIALWADRRELVGVLALGPKLSEAEYGHEDLTQLTMLVDEAGTAISLAQSIIEKRIAQEATQAISANHAAVLNNIADGVLVLDLQGNFLSANPALLQMIPQEHLNEILASPLEKTIKWKRKVFSVTAAPVPDVGTVAVFRDETRRSEIERAKDSMLATASHELRTPLAAVMNYLEMLIVFTRMGKVNTEAFNEHLNRALENSQRLQRLVQAILDQAQIQAGRMVLKKECFDLRDSFMRTQQLFDNLIAQKGLVYELVVDPNVPAQIIGDADRLQQVLINLIGNAIKFTERGKVRVAVRCGDAGMLTVAVEDTGPGIPPEQLPDIFEPFRRSSDYAQREHQGAGLGLSIVKEIVTMMGGHIGVSSEVGVGSVFTMMIPLDVA